MVGHASNLFSTSVLSRASLLASSHANLVSLNESLPIVRFENATFYKQHPVPDASNHALFPNLSFSLPSFSDPRQYWSVTSPSSIGKTTFLEILRGQHLCIPPTARSYPYLATHQAAGKNSYLRAPGRALQYVGLSSKRDALEGSGTRGAYLSARYESRREYVDFSLLDYLKGKSTLHPSEDGIAKERRAKNQRTLHQIIRQLKLGSLLDIPVGNLSNGQTRRARIAKALMRMPEVLLLDEPFMGLDPPARRSISSLLYRLAYNSSPRVFLALRPQDRLPDWITHVICLDSDSSVAYQGPKQGALGKFIFRNQPAPFLIPGYEPYSERSTDKEQDMDVPDHSAHSPTMEMALTSDDAPAINNALESSEERGGDEALVEMKGVEVKYAEKPVLGAWQQEVDGQPQNGLWWTVKRGERWGVFGPNGSGKTTLLSLICSDHPQTYSLPIKLFGHSRLPIPGQPGIPVFDIQSRIGHSSPEVHAFFPRHLSVRQTLESAWADTFRGRAVLSHENDNAVDACLRYFECELNLNMNASEASPNLLLRRTRKRTGRSCQPAEKKQLDAYFGREVDWADSVRFGDLSVSSQRVALLLRALVKKPDLVILDEAFSGMDIVSRDKCMLFLAHGESYLLEIQRGVARAKRTILALEHEDYSAKVTVSGLEERQALICISQLEEEVPSLVTNWLCLPEPNEGKPARFGHMTESIRGKKWWDRLWGL